MRDPVHLKIQDESKYQKQPKLTKYHVQSALDFVISKLDQNIQVFTDTFPEAASADNIYKGQKNDYGWTTGFYTGMIWLAYEMTGDMRYKNIADIQVETFITRMDSKLGILDTHDLGFLYTLSCVASYKLTGNMKAKEVALQAADCLMDRYKEKGKFIQAWGDIHDESMYRLIIDCYLNLPLLFWAFEETGNQKYYDVAYNHAKTALEVTVREDASTYHTHYFDPESGAPTTGTTHQGYANDSCWSRGQAWGIYGLPLVYKYTKDIRFIEHTIPVTNYFLNYLPEDYVAYWDLVFTSGEEERDSSAAAIAVCGLLETIKYLEDKDLNKLYKNAALHMLQSLIDNYMSNHDEKSNGILLHGVYSKPHNGGVDECVIWGDYFFMEALVRLLKDWELYW